MWKFCLVFSKSIKLTTWPSVSVQQDLSVLLNKLLTVHWMHTRLQIIQEYTELYTLLFCAELQACQKDYVPLISWVHRYANWHVRNYTQPFPMCKLKVVLLCWATYFIVDIFPPATPKLDKSSAEKLFLINSSLFSPIYLLKAAVTLLKVQICKWYLPVTLRKRT